MSKDEHLPHRCVGVTHLPIADGAFPCISKVFVKLIYGKAGVSKRVAKSDSRE